MVATREWLERNEADWLPVFEDATSLCVSSPASNMWAGWPIFKVASAASTTGAESSLVMVTRERRSSKFDQGTGPFAPYLWPPALDITQDRGDGLATLIVAAQEGDESAFIAAVNDIDWLQRAPADYARAVRLALASGVHRMARRLATQGAERYPEHQDLHKMARILAPPRVIEAEDASAPSVQANQAWLRRHADRYKGQWVALRDGMLLASAETAGDLKARLDSTAGVMLTKVF